MTPTNNNIEQMAYLDLVAELERVTAKLEAEAFGANNLMRQSDQLRAQLAETEEQFEQYKQRWPDLS